MKKDAAEAASGSATIRDAPKTTGMQNEKRVSHDTGPRTY
jgi:hypothetical protein